MSNELVRAENSVFEGFNRKEVTSTCDFLSYLKQFDPQQSQS
jgi:hypothetical protein